MSTPNGYNADTGLMDFSLALQEMRRGLRVRRKSWPRWAWIGIEGGILVNDEGVSNFPLATSIILSDDWEVVL
jgi:hypothetical protein